jgi:hypothetical protein
MKLSVTPGFGLSVNRLVAERPLPGCSCPRRSTHSGDSSRSAWTSARSESRTRHCIGHASRMLYTQGDASETEAFLLDTSREAGDDGIESSVRGGLSLLVVYSSGFCGGQVRAPGPRGYGSGGSRRGTQSQGGRPAHVSSTRVDCPGGACRVGRGRTAPSSAGRAISEAVLAFSDVIRAATRSWW